MMDLSKILPPALAEQRRFIGWSLQTNRQGRLTKKPHGSINESQNLRLLADLEEQLSCSAKGGIGLVMSGGVAIHGQQLVALDLDGCCDPRTGEPVFWAQKIFDQFDDAYIELSPSRTGYRLLFCAAEAGSGFKRAMPHPAPDGVDKKPDAQLFVNKGYVTLTGNVLRHSEFKRVYDLGWLREFCGADGQSCEREEEFPVGFGKPPCAESIQDAVCKSDKGQLLIDAKWQELAYKSASEAYFALVRLVLRAARDHGEAAAQFLLTDTTWGLGWVEDSADPDKYADKRWVRAEVGRAHAKRGTTPACEAFQSIESKGFVRNGSNDETGPAPHGIRPISVLDRWERDGPLVHEPTGLDELDEQTRGGPVFGEVWFVNGPPDAGKTLFLAHVAYEWAKRGVPVGILAVDEDADGLMLRLGQRLGFSREQCEKRCSDVLTVLRGHVNELPLLFFEAGTAVEQAASEVADFAASSARPGALFIDSLQTVEAEGAQLGEPRYEAVSARVKAIKEAASSHGLFVLATSEMSRIHYRNRRQAEELDPIASGKESGAIEYAAKVLLALRSVSSDVIAITIAKNKHGSRHVAPDQGIALRMDRDQQTLKSDREYVFEPRGHETVLDDAAQLVLVVAETQGVTQNRLLELLREKLGKCSAGRLRESRRRLGDSIVLNPGRNQSKKHFLDGTKVPKEVLDRLGDSERQLVESARVGQ